MDRSGPNGPSWTKSNKVDRMDKIGLNRNKMDQNRTKVDRIRMNGHNGLNENKLD